MNGLTPWIYLSLVLAGFAGGYKVATWIETSREVERIKAELDSVKLDRDAADTARQLADKLRAQSDAALLDLQELQRVYNDNRKALVPRVVESNRDCDLGPGAISLLNSAIRADPVPGATGSGTKGGQSTAADHWFIPAPANAR